ncbi:MAG: type II 3-dehydroquinate dehydratase [Pseudomonadota bacterium]
MSPKAAKTILVIHGPNLNMLGTREPAVYGKATLADIDAELTADATAMGLEVALFQSNHEGAIVDRIQAAVGTVDGLIINPGAYTHTSVAIRDALLLLEVPVIEVHISNVYKRETFRHRSLISDVVTGKIVGCGVAGYRMALSFFAQ